MLMTNGNLPLTAAQKRCIVDFVRNGKALIGAHCATLTLYDYPEFGECSAATTCARSFRRQRSQRQVAILKVEDPNHPATRMLGAQLAAERGVLRVRPHGVGREPADRERVLLFGRCASRCRFSRDRVHVLLSLDTERPT